MDTLAWDNLAQVTYTGTKRLALIARRSQILALNARPLCRQHMGYVYSIYENSMNPASAAYGSVCPAIIGPLNFESCQQPRGDSCLHGNCVNNLSPLTPGRWLYPPTDLPHPGHYQPGQQGRPTEDPGIRPFWANEPVDRPMVWYSDSQAGGWVMGGAPVWNAAGIHPSGPGGNNGPTGDWQVIVPNEPYTCFAVLISAWYLGVSYMHPIIDGANLYICYGNRWCIFA